MFPTALYKCTVESILYGYITAWFGNGSVQGYNKLQRVVDFAQSHKPSSPLLSPLILHIALEK